MYQQIELSQPLRLNQGFTYTTTSGAAETAVTLNRMNFANSIAIVVELADAYIEFDRTATTSSMLMPANSAYTEDNISIDSTISILRVGAANARIRGILWGRS
mgnify:CR=1 FL=1